MTEPTEHVQPTEFTRSTDPTQPTQLTKSYEELSAENEMLKGQVEEFNEVLHAIGRGEVDALVVTGPKGEHVFALEEKDNAYRILIEAMNDGAVTLASDGTILYCNHHFAELAQSSLEKVIGSSIYRFIPGADHTAFKTLQQSLSRGELTLQAENESTMPIYVSFSALQLSGSQVFCAVITDITERKLNEARKRLQANILDSIGQAAIAIDNNRRIIYWNKAAEILYGWRSDEVMGCDLMKISSTDPSDEQVAEIMSRLEKGESWSGEYPVKRRDGSTFTALVTDNPVFDEQGRMIGIVGISSDISKRKCAEEELRRAKEAAEAAVQAKAAFLANMSHEIRTPMNSVIGFTSILLDEPLTPEHKDYVESIRINGEALLALINDILDFSKLEKEKIEFELHPFDLRQRLEESLDLVATRAAEKGLDLAYTIDENVPEVIINDSARLRQVLANLLSNAVKFTDRGDIVITVSSKPKDQSHEIHFAVQDTGIGIPQDQMNKLFQPFSQVTSTARLNEGTGLGLAISKKLVEMMGGRIWVESEEGKGSTFHFTINAVAESQSGNGKIPAGPQPHLAKRSVLILDDNKTIRRLLAHQVQSWGMVPIIFSSSSEALDKILKGIVPDIAILDGGMPNMDGIILAETFRRYGMDLPIVMLTSLGQHIPLDLSAASLEKPIKLMQLHDTLTSVLAGRPVRKQNQVPVVNQTDVSPLRVLLAEDNVSSQKVALRMLKRLGYRVDMAATGVEVLQALERQPYDVVFMDIKMPEMDGYEATKKIRQRWPSGGPRIIALTAYALRGDKEKCLEAGMDDYISKPVKIEDLANALSKCPTPPPKNKN